MAVTTIHPMINLAMVDNLYLILTAEQLTAVTMVGTMVEVVLTLALLHATVEPVAVTTVVLIAAGAMTTITRRNAARMAMVGATRTTATSTKTMGTTNMKTLLIAMLLASTAFATEPPAPGRYKSDGKDIVCHPVLPLKKKTVTKKVAPVATKCVPTVVEKRVTKEVVREVPADVTVTSPAPTSWEVTRGKANVTWVERQDDPWFRLMGHVAVGVGARVPHWSGLLGLRVAFPKVHLGAEVYTPFQYGLGFQGLVYPIETKNVNWHLNLGVLGLGKSFLSTQDVPRTWDLTVGTGVEIALVKHLALAIDWRMSVPSPVFIADHSSPVYSNGNQVTGEAGRYLDVKHVLGNSFTQSQLLVGLLFY